MKKIAIQTWQSDTLSTVAGGLTGLAVRVDVEHGVVLRVTEPTGAGFLARNRPQCGGTQDVNDILCFIDTLLTQRRNDAYGDGVKTMGQYPPSLLQLGVWTRGRSQKEAGTAVHTLSNNFACICIIHAKKMLGQTKIIILRLCPTVKSLKMRVKYASILMGGLRFSAFQRIQTQITMLFCYIQWLSAELCVGSHPTTTAHFIVSSVHCPTIITGSGGGFCFGLGLD